MGLFGGYQVKVALYPKSDQKVCLNMMRKDQLCAIAPTKRKWIANLACYGNQAHHI